MRRHTLNSSRNAYRESHPQTTKRNLCNSGAFRWTRRLHPVLAVDASGPTLSTLRPQPAVLAAENGKDAGPNRLGPNGPKLPPRPPKAPKASGNRTGSPKSTSGGLGGGPFGGGGPGRTDRKLASLSVYSGLVGTTAIVLANFAGIDLWANFDFDAQRDLTIAVVASVPLQLMNCALLLPSFATERPPFLSKPEDDPQVLAAVAAAAAAPAAVAQAVSAPAAAAPEALAAAADGNEEVPSTQAAATAMAAETAGADGASKEPTGPSAAAEQSTGPKAPNGPPAGFVPAAAWGTSAGRGDEGAEGKGPWAELKAALHLAQGYYISNNPTSKLSTTTEAAYTLVDSAAGEMLYRGVGLTWLASWLVDRVIEAGLEETLMEQLPAALGGGPPGAHAAQGAVATLGLYGICECAVGAAAGAFVVWSVLARSQRAVRQLEVFMSGVAAASAQRANGAKGPAAGAEGAAAGDKGAEARKPQPQLVLGAGSPGLVSASSAGLVMQRAAVIQAARDAAQVLLLNAVFISTGGNLAASYTAAVINQLVISALQRRGLLRMQERNTRFMKELKAYNAQVMKIVAKHRSKLPKAAAARLDAMADDSSDRAAKPASPQPSSAEGTAATLRGTASAPAAVPASPTSNGTGPGDAAALDLPSSSPADAAVMALAAAATAPAAAAPSGAAGAEAEAPRATTKARTGLENALLMLDQLVPEPSKPDKSAPGAAKKP